MARQYQTLGGAYVNDAAASREYQLLGGAYLNEGASGAAAASYGFAGAGGVRAAAAGLKGASAQIAGLAGVRGADVSTKSVSLGIAALCGAIAAGSGGKATASQIAAAVGVLGALSYQLPGQQGFSALVGALYSMTVGTARSTSFAGLAGLRAALAYSLPGEAVPAAIFEVDLKAHLQGDAAIAALVLDRIYPVLRPQGSVAPAITFSRVFADYQTSLDGWTSGKVQIRLQIDVWAKTYESARAIKAAVEARMNTAADSFRSTLQFEDHQYEPTTREHHVVLDYYCMFRTTVEAPDEVVGNPRGSAGLERDLVAHLLADSEISAEIGQRLYPLVRPEGSALAAVVYRLQATPQNSLDGYTSGLKRCQLLLDVYASTHWQAHAIARACTLRMNDHGASFRATPGGEIDAFDDEARAYRVRLEFLVWFRE